MPFIFTCPACQAKLTVTDAAAGKTGPCPKCGSTITAPMPQTTPKPQWSTVPQSQPTALQPCPSCGHPVSRQAVTCPSCGHPILAVKMSSSGPRGVSWGWTLLFGCIYFAVKGWWKAAIAGLVIGFLSAGLSWFIIPFFAQQFVDSVEDYGSLKVRI